MGKASMSLLVATMLGFLVLCGPAWAVEPNLVSNWRFDDGSGTTAYDSAGDNDGTVYGAEWTAGQIDGALGFDGVDDYVDVGDQSSLEATSFTITAWIKPGDVSSLQQIAGKYGHEPVDNCGHGYRLEIRNGNASLLIDPAGCGNTNPLESTTLLQREQWYFVAGTYDGSTAKIYLNGEPEDSGARTLNAYYTNFYIGAAYSDYHDTFHDHFNGAIDDVRICGRALSAEEIQRLYLEGLSDYERAIICVENAIDKKQAALETVDAALVEESDAYDALEELLESGDYGDLKKGDIVTAKQKIHSAIRNEERSLDALEKSIEGLYDALAALGWEPEPEPNLREPISHWNFDEGSGTIAYDSAGDNDGTIYGAAWTTGQLDGALSFDGVDDYVAVNGVEIHKEAAYSIIIWVKGTAQADNRVYSEGSSSNNDPLLNVGSHHISTSKARFIVRDDNGIIRLDAESIATAFDNTWHQIAWVDNNGTYATYIDGVADVSGSYIKNAKTLDRTTIGAFGRIGYSCFFDGSIDDVRIYDRALAAEEIQELYLDGLSKSGKGKGK